MVETQDKPNFGFLMQLMNFDNNRNDLGWGLMSELIKSKVHHK